MTKRITHVLLRHLETLDVNIQLVSGEIIEAKGDRPTRKARLTEAPAAAENIKEIVAAAEGRVWLYASTNTPYETKDELIGVRPTPNRSGEGLGYVVEELAKLGVYSLEQYEDPRIVLVSELAPMSRKRLDELAVNTIKQQYKARGTKKPEIEAAIVAYCAAGQFADPATDKPEVVTSRYLDHVANVARHFDELQDGQQGVVLSMGHEPCLSFVLACVLGDQYAKIAADGAVKTGTGIHFVMEQTKFGGQIIDLSREHGLRESPATITEITMQYKGLEAYMKL
ncbi:MAG: hypothetical protein WC254_00380 [Candidatus Woesearchaeota archaeon]|jgi:hypothetical protein